MSERLYCIAVYQHNDTLVIRKCCDIAYNWHGLEELRLPQCQSEIVARGLTKEEALTIGTNLSKELQVSLAIN